MRAFCWFLPVFLLIENAMAVTCPSGFDDVSNDYPATFYSKNINGFCPAGYEPYTAPSVFEFTFNGLILSSEPTVCGADSHYVNGTCTPYTTDNCESGFYKDAEHSATFYAKNSGVCPDGYDIYTHGSNLNFIFNGMIMPNAPTVCTSGHYVNGTCAPYSSDGCISGYVDAGTDGVVAAVDASGACPSGYNSLWSYQSCTADTTDSLCTTLCNGGMSHTAAGYCAAACSIGLTKLHVGDRVFAVYGTKTTQPSFVVSDGTDMCYVNLAPGRASGAINVNYNNNIYHTTD